jgi:ribonuclease T1
MWSVRRSGWSLLLLLVVVLAVVLVRPGGDVEPAGPEPTVSIPAGLPAEVGETLALVDRGGPFPYRRDGVVFMNREGRLPQHGQGYWHEYTVPTPGSADRGARRLVVGRDGEAYYTGDHYRTFRKVRSAGGSS